MSSETFWDGVQGSEKLKRKLRRCAKRGVAMGSDACRAALRAYGRGIKRLGVVTPYMPVGDRQVRRFFTECGYEVVNLLGLKCGSPTLIAHVSKKTLRDAILRVNRGKVDAVVQVGTNLAMAEVAAGAEFWLDKPVLAINTATYWYALRDYGIKDRMPGWGSLFASTRLFLAARARIAVLAIRGRHVEVERAQQAAPGVGNLVFFFALDEQQAAGAQLVPRAVRRSLRRCPRVRRATDPRRGGGCRRRLPCRPARAPSRPPGRRGCRGLRGIPGRTAVAS